MSNDIKAVYLPMAADIIHYGHVNIIKIARDIGRVIIGLNTDDLITQYKRIPIINYEDRKNILMEIKGVEEVIPNNEINHTANLLSLKPEYVVHGNDWKNGFLCESRNEILKTIGNWGGQLIEPEYYKGISTSMIISKIRSMDNKHSDKCIYYDTCPYV